MTDIEKAYGTGFCYMFIVIIIIIMWATTHLCKDVDIFFKTNYVLICDNFVPNYLFFSGLVLLSSTFYTAFPFFV